MFQMTANLSFVVGMAVLLTFQMALAADPQTDRIIQDAQKKYPPGDYNMSEKKDASAVSSTARSEEEIKTQALFDNLMAAVIADDYDRFLANCDAMMKAALTKQMLAGVNQQIAPRAKQGYEAQYLGELLQRGSKVHLWRLRFKDMGDDVLATMSVKDGQVGGFYLH